MKRAVSLPPPESCRGAGGGANPGAARAKESAAFCSRCASKLAPMPRASNLALMKLVRRAEAADPAMLVETFVDAGTLFASLASPDHQISLRTTRHGEDSRTLVLAGAAPRLRRITHLCGHADHWLDLRNLRGHNLSISERGTRLLWRAALPPRPRFRCGGRRSSGGVGSEQRGRSAATSVHAAQRV